MYLPEDLLAEHEVRLEDIYSGQPSSGLSSVVEKVASAAKGHLDEARALQGQIPWEARPLMLPAVACGAYLDRLQSQGYNALAPSLAKGSAFAPVWHQLKVRYRFMRGSF